MGDGDSVGGRKNPKLACDSGKRFQSLLGLIPVLGFVRVMLEAQQGNRSHGISRGGGRVLNRLAAGGKYSKAFALGSGLGIVEPSGDRVEELRDHGIGNGAGELEITE